jgi:hypothetical protein
LREPSGGAVGVTGNAASPARVGLAHVTSGNTASLDAVGPATGLGAAGVTSGNTAGLGGGGPAGGVGVGDAGGVGLPTSGVIGSVLARELLTEVAVYQQRARRPAGLWPPLVVFGTVAAAGAPLGLDGSLAVNLWWLATAPIGFAVVGVLMSRQGYRRGIEHANWLLPSLGVAGFAAAFAGLWLSGLLHLPGDLGWVLLVAAGYLGWSRFARSLPVAAVAVSLAAVGTALTLAPVPGWTVQLGVGVTMIIGGLALRHGPESA